MRIYICELFLVILISSLSFISSCAVVSGHSSGLFAVFVDFAFKDVCESNVTYILEAYTLWISAAVLSAIVRFYGKFHHSSQEKLDPCSMS